MGGTDLRSVETPRGTLMAVDDAARAVSSKTGVSMAAGTSFGELGDCTDGSMG